MREKRILYVILSFFVIYLWKKFSTGVNNGIENLVQPCSCAP